jgi:hypothetical protein
MNEPYNIERQENENTEGLLQDWREDVEGT